MEERQQLLGRSLSMKEFCGLKMGNYEEMEMKDFYHRIRILPGEVVEFFQRFSL
jgi:hypothetical protein